MEIKHHFQSMVGKYWHCIDHSRALLQEIEPLSDKYKEIFYRAATGLYSADDLAKMFNHSQKNLNADFNKNLGSHLKDYLELDERVGITSLRRILFKKGYCVINDILTSRYVENSELERSASDKISTESEHWKLAHFWGD